MTLLTQSLSRIINLFLLFSFLLLQACVSPFSDEVDSSLSTSYYYERGSGKIIYSPLGNSFSLGYDEMDADKATFKPIAEDFGKDKKHVYYKSMPQLQADLLTFEIKDGIIKDKNHVYEADNFDLRIVNGADLESFRYLSADEYATKWAKDDFNYFLYNTLVQVDYASFRELENGLVVDKDYVYQPLELFENEAGEMERPVFKLKKVDIVADEVQDITNVYARMGNTIYSNDFYSGFQKIVFDDISQIEVVAAQCIVIDETLFVNGLQFPFDAVDINSFENIGGDSPFEYTHDKNHVYYQGHPLPNANVANFQLIRWGYSKDDKHVYYQEAIVTGANPQTFTYDEKAFEFVDGTTVYRDGKVFKSQHP